MVDRVGVVFYKSAIFIDLLKTINLHESSEFIMCVELPAVLHIKIVKHNQLLTAIKSTILFYFLYGNGTYFDDTAHIRCDMRKREKHKNELSIQCVKFNHH